MRKLHVLLVGALAALAAPAAAQVNFVPQVGVTSDYRAKVTYSAAFIGLPPAASATDVICLAGSATKTVKLISVRLSGTAGTLVTVPVTLVRRIAVNTAGTAATTTANPANTISKRDTANPTATAVPIAYSANPTITDSTPTYLDSASLTLGTTAAATVTNPLLFDYSPLQTLAQPVTLSGAAAQVCLNFNAVSISSGVLNGSLTWTEE
jgi:hypothetical protein